jgi:LysR family transcriptional regulator for bpeEF and oprC
MIGYADTVAFVYVAEHGGFTAAAKATGMSKARLSRNVRELEERLGTPLLKRSTRRLGLTEAGKAYFEECAPLIAGLAHAEVNIAELTAQPGGQVVITAPTWFATRILAPMLVEFRTVNSGFRSEIITTHAAIDLISEGIDLAFRLWIGNLPDSLLTARHLATLPQRVFAGAQYVARRGAPTRLAELGDHTALVTHVRKSSEREHWWLTDGETAGEYPIDTAAIASDPAVLEAMMIAGDGLLLATELQLRAAVERGEAQAVLPAWQGRPVELYAILPAGRHSTRKVRLLLDFIIERLGVMLAT